jgi:hypothetical protein
MAHEFVVIRNGNLETYNKYEDIPETFENLVKFLPEIPPGPHTKEQHEEMDSWNDKLRILLERERKNASSNKNR